MADFITAEQRADLVKLYIAYFNRAPEADGLNFHAAKLLADINSGMSPAQALTARADAFYADALTLGAWTGYTAAMTAEDFVKKVYANVLLRPGEGGDAPNAGEIAYWVNELATGSVTRGSIITQFLADQKVLAENGSAEEKIATAKVMAVLDARLEVALEFSKMEISGELRGEAAHDAGVAALAGVKDAATAAAKIAELAGLVNAGDTYTLTTGADNIAGTSGSDTINGNVDTIANGGTFNNADVIKGGAGTDTFNLSIADTGVAAANWAAGATVSDVEIFKIRDVDATNNAALTFAGVTGATQIWSNGSSQSLEVTNVQNAVTAGLANTAANFKLGYAADKLASATATQAVALNGAITGAGAAVTLELDVAGADKITKLTVDSSTAKSNVVVKGTAASTDVAVTDLTVTGNAAVTLAQDTVGATGEFNTLKTINASGLTAGGLTLDLSGQTANIDTAFTGSAGDDKLTLNAAQLTSKDVLTGGNGTDTLVLDIAGAASSVAANAGLIATGAAAGVTGFETLSVTATNKVVATGVTLTVDTSAVTGVNKVVLGSDLGAAAASVISVANLGDVNTLAITAGQTGVVNATYKPAAIAAGTDLGLTLELGAAKAAGITAAAVGVTQTANLTIKSAGTSVNTITDLTVAQNTALKTITVTGDNALTISNDLDVKALTTLDARGLTLAKTTDSGLTLSNAITNGATKGITIYGSNGVDTIKGSAVGDTIWGGLGGDTITLGTAGNTDIVRYTAVTESTSTAKDAISVFEGARDLLKFEGITVAGNFSLQTAAFTAGGNASALIASTTLGGAQDLSIDFNGDGVSDMVISLTGVGTLTTANFEFA